MVLANELRIKLCYNVCGNSQHKIVREYVETLLNRLTLEIEELLGSNVKETNRRIRV